MIKDKEDISEQELTSEQGEQGELTGEQDKSMPTLKNKKHMLFCLEYLSTLNGPKSYKKISPNCTMESAYVMANRLLARDDIQRFIDELIYSQSRVNSKINSKKAIAVLEDRGRFIEELAKVAYSPPGRSYSTAKMDALKMLGVVLGISNVTDELKVQKGSVKTTFKESEEEQ